MVDLLQGRTLDPDRGMYSARVLGFNGQNCEFDGFKISETCMFKSSLPEIDLENWDNYFICKLDLGYQVEGFLTHPQLGKIYVKPNTYNELTNVDIWIEIGNKSTTSPDFIGNEGVLGWFNFNKDNVINHPILTNIINSSILGTYQDNLAVFMFSDTTQKYHAFICNTNKNVFISDGLENLDSIFTQPVSFYPIDDIGSASPLWNNAIETINVLENTTSVYIRSIILEGTEPISFSIDEDSEEVFIVNEETGELNFRNPPDYEAGNNDYQIILSATNIVGSAILELYVSVVNVGEISPLWSESIEYIDMLSSDSDVIFSTYLTQGEDNITYSISGSGAQDFSVNSVTGEMKFNIPPDFETTDYIITLTAENEMGSDSVDLYISVFKIFSPQTKQDLQDAVNLWVVDNSQALITYREISSWDTSAITSMSWLFQGQVNFNSNINSWDTSNVISMAGMFDGATSFNQPIGGWTTDGVTSMNNMFKSATQFNQPIGTWTTNNVTSMAGMFNGATQFNQPIGDWTMDGVTSMVEMFKSATRFNQPIGTWNTIKVKRMNHMFDEATSFNQPIGGWKTENVTRMTSMFRYATEFNQNINDWKVSSLTNNYALWYMFFNATSFNSPLSKWDTSSWVSTRGMFRGASAFNQPLDGWKTSKISDFSSMFYDSSSFNQSLASWDISSMSNADQMLYGVELSVDNYNSLLNGWAEINPGELSIPFDIRFIADRCDYSGSGSSARDTLTNTYQWTIIDGDLV